MSQTNRSMPDEVCKWPCISISEFKPNFEFESVEVRLSKMTGKKRLTVLRSFNVTKTVSKLMLRITVGSK